MLRALSALVHESSTADEASALRGRRLGVAAIVALAVFFGAGAQGALAARPSWRVYLAQSKKALAARPSWRVYLAQSKNALAAQPTFTQVAANSTPTHYGQICTNGIVCGSSDRSLLDLISVAVDCKGLALIAYGGNTKAQEAADETYVHLSRQVGGSVLAAPAACALQ